MLMTWDFKLQAELSKYSSLQITRSYYGVGSFEVRIHRTQPGALELMPGKVLFLSDALHKAMLIEKTVSTDDQITASGKLIKGIASRRVCVPPATDDGHFGWDRFIGSAEAAYHHYAAAYLYAPEDAKRAIPLLDGTKNQDRGMVLPWQSRFGNLDALLKEIGEATGVGWDVRPDFAAKRYIFEAVVGRDFTTGPSKVVLSTDNRNLSGATHTLDEMAAKSTAYVGGAGEDENRLILSFENEVAGLARRETWVDGGSIEDVSMLELAAKNKLDAAEEKDTLTAEVLDTGLARYGRDYDIGDKVIIQTNGYQAMTRLIEMRESYETGTRSLSATFGAAPVTLTSELQPRGSVAIR